MTGRILIALLASAGLYAQETSADTRLRHSEQAFQAIMKAPDSGIPQDLLDSAHCVVIVPDLIKAAFIVGGQYGRGFASCRAGHGWSAPAAVRMEGGSFGLQLGGSSTDLIMLVMNQHGMDRLLTSKFTIGGDVAGAAGPRGIAHQSITPKMAARRPPRIPAAIIQKETIANSGLCVARKPASNPNDAANNPKGKTTNMG